MAENKKSVQECTDELIENSTALLGFSKETETGGNFHANEIRSIGGLGNGIYNIIEVDGKHIIEFRGQFDFEKFLALIKGVQ